MDLDDPAVRAEAQRLINLFGSTASVMLDHWEHGRHAEFVEAFKECAAVARLGTACLSEIIEHRAATHPDLAALDAMIREMYDA